MINLREDVLIQHLLPPLVLSLNEPFRSDCFTLTVALNETAFTQVSPSTHFETVLKLSCQRTRSEGIGTLS